MDGVRTYLFGECFNFLVDCLGHGIQKAGLPFVYELVEIRHFGLDDFPCFQFFTFQLRYEAF